MRIGNREITADSPPYIIAELGVNHDGSVERALELVKAAADAKAVAIKLQLFETDRLLSRAAKLAAYQKDSGATDPFAMLRSLELSIEQMRPIVEEAHRLGLHAIVTVFSVELVEIAERLPWDAYKTASPDLINKPLLEAMMRTGKPLLVSAGAANLEEVKQCSARLNGHPHVLFQCVSSYPTRDESAAMGGRLAMMGVDPYSLGYSDHTDAIDAGGLAVASGATVLEKHLTHDRLARGPDHAASLDPAGFAEYVRLAQRAYAMLGRREKIVQSIEADVRQVSRQSITSTQLLSKNHVLLAADLTIKRPGTGIPPFELDRVIGRRLATNVEADMPLLPEDLA